MNALAIYTPPEQDRGDILWDPGAHAHALQVAGEFAASGLVPEHFQRNPAAVMIGLQIAKRAGRDPWSVLQSLYVVHGRPGWAAKYLIALANAGGLPVRWRIERRPEPLTFDRLEWYGPKGNRQQRTVKASMPDMTVTAYSPAVPDEPGLEASSQMAIDEGWAQSTKYSTMPELMLRYRSASMLIGFLRPDLQLGIPTVEELEDVAAAEVVEVPKPVAASAPAPIAEPQRGMAALRSVVETPSSPSAQAPAGGSSGAAPSGDGQAPKGDPVKDALLEELRAMFRDHPALVENAARLQATEPRSFGRCGVEKLAKIRDAVRAGIGATEAPKPTGTPWDKLVGSALEVTVDAIARRLGDAIAGRVWESIGVAEGQEETDETKRRYGRALEAEEQALKAEAAE